MPLVGEIGGIPEAATISPPPLDDDIAILKFWLTDRLARCRVPDQLAVACRRLVEIAEQGRRIRRRDIFQACLTCGGTLARVASDDPYMQLLRCDRGHEYWWRGDALTWTDSDVRMHLAADPDDETLLTLIDYYSGDHPVIQPYVHPQLRSALKRLRPP